ncbi:hypothetical protein HJA87_23590 [Rhizobium bangladeshense]|uniref:Uncharacterized protein n=1 Tax=Rhizobium bangladeshense TaxID=1138189 RepID=A0ABS7LNF9_9HYPH|nr:hypothetical protein [Rhizobium bangladeshense]MBX4870007.1 hypothetical protein [Rhizobium bangladeshense]MBX4886329.1 hypothetical protein [Rhizobium bangladeshense]MBY3592840.1 hypothetical protein [Rhizobium bangladeshense]
MAIVVEPGVGRHRAKRATDSVMSQLRHAAGICTITGSFIFLFAVVIGLIR